MNYEIKYATSKYVSKSDRETAINLEIDALAKKRDRAADAGMIATVWSYQVDIDKLVSMLEPKLS